MLLFLDFETYYDREYSLKKMTPAEYIFDPRFEAICMGVAKNNEAPEIVVGPDIERYLAALDRRRTTTVTYNSLFDNAILAWRFGFVPGRMVDGLGMARSLLGSRLRSLSLGAVSEYLGVGEKGNEINEAIGLRRADFLQNPDLWDRFRTYCLKDTTLLREIFTRLFDEFPVEEFAVMDAVLRCCIEPKFHCDISLLEDYVRDIRAKKDRLYDAVGMPKEAISGNASFVSLLEAQGVIVETKEGKRGPIPAIAKTDAFMQRLLEDERPEVQCLAAARLGAKSTLEERRSERLMAIASLPWPGGAALMPIPLRYSGAHTWRLSGDWKINMQNLPSTRMGNPILRRSLMAPPGHKVLVGDLAQIEARLVAWFCDSELLLSEFREERDPYSQLASRIFELQVDKATLNGVARHIGKAGILGCGYGMGATKFYESVLRQGRAALSAQQFELLQDVWTSDLAAKSVNTYRKRYSEVRFMWSRLEDALRGSWRGLANAGDWVHGPIHITSRDRYGVVAGPGRREIRYPGAMQDTHGDFWWFDGGVPRKIYGAALLENIIQFLARIVMFDIAMRLQARGLYFVHQVHDELVFIVPDRDVDEACKVLKDEMIRPPVWCPYLPLGCDVGYGQRYGDCK